jgi:two-component system phosphate regulon sensor histidine kinase PhoR
MHGIPLFFEQELGGGTYCDVTINPIRDEKLIQGILVVMHDITERKRIMELKTELVGNLSHELKTPVAILKGYLETILAHPDDPELLRNSLAKALVNVDRQNSIINDMLKLNLLETTDSFPFEPIDIGEVLDTCIGSLEPKITERGIHVTREKKDIPAAVSGNRFLAEEVFYNLIDNAINYNRPEGKIIISSEITGSVLAVLISDTGIGIPRESIGRVFERFYRVDRSRSRATGGTGLGLSIVKHAAGLLGWTIQVASDASGTTFRIGIPFS